MKPTVLGIAALLLVFCVSASASATSVSIYASGLYEPNPVPGLALYSLRVNLEPGVRLGGLDLLVFGGETLTVNSTLGGISAPASVLVPDVVENGWSSLVINNIANGVPIAVGPVYDLEIATFTAAFNCKAYYGEPGCGPSYPLYPGDDYFGGTVFDDNLVLIADYAIVPEPGSAALLSVGLAGLALARRPRELARHRLGK